jgi:hypothetical protein
MEEMDYEGPELNENMACFSYSSYDEQHADYEVVSNSLPHACDPLIDTISK